MSKSPQWLVRASICSIAILCSPAFAKPAATVTAVTYIDAIPDQFVAGNEEKAQVLLRAMDSDTQKDPGLISFTVLQEIERPNHFTLLEVWKDEKALNAHEQAAHTRQFRNDLQPLIGSPYDTLVTKAMN